MTKKELTERQSWTLDQKIDHTLGAIDHFYRELNGNVYISFSGGKDSTVLLHLARRIYPNIKAMFIKTGNEFPEICKFVSSFDNVDIVRPKMTFKQVIEKYGFPLVSKEQSQYINELKHTKSDNLRHTRRYGRVDRSGKKNNSGKVSEKWLFLSEENFDVTHKCCKKLKKDPAKRYEKQSGLYPITGETASESRLREQQYIKNGGCNVFGEKCKSTPMMIWTEKDILEYIDRFNVEICSVYGNGTNRTGCMMCGFGAHFDNGFKFKKLSTTHPKVWSTFSKYENNGVSFKDALSVYLKETEL